MAAEMAPAVAAEVAAEVAEAMSWTRIRPRFIALREACFSGRPVAAPWQA